MCLPRFVAICVTFNDLCCRTKRCGLLSRIHLWVTDQSWHTGFKWFRITLRTCFCILLTSNWEVSSGCSLNNFINFAQTTQKFVINSYIEAIETKLSIGKHTLRVFTRNFEEIVGKTLFGCFIFVFASIVAFHVTFNDLCCSSQPCSLLSWIHLWVTNQSLQTGQNDSVIHFEVAFVVCWYHFGKLLQVVVYTFW